MGRRTFSRAEVEQLRRLILAKQTADPSQQKVLRARMRAIGFYISDFAADSAGFVVSDLDDLISRGVITCRASSAATHRAGGGWSGCSSGLRT